MIENLTKTEEKMLHHFFQQPEEEIHLRGLARETSIPYSSVRSAVKTLEAEGFIEGEERGNMTVYSASGSDRFRAAKRAYNIYRLYESGLVAELQDVLRPDALVLFGSYRNGADHRDSDIDIAVVNGREQNINLKAYEEELGRDVHLVHLPDAAEEDNEFKNTLANGYVLSGYLEVV